MDQSNLTAKVLEVTEAAQIDPRRIEIEVTESLIMKDIRAATSQLQQLRAAGFSIAIDDFGTGYSSLTYLKNLPVDTLKIDRTFVDDLEQDKPDVAIVRSIITLGDNLGLSVIAEGVECQTHLDLLVSEGCRMGQGFFFARPIPAEEFFELLETAGKKMPHVKFATG